MTIAKTELFSTDLQNASALFKALSHPARLAILQFLSDTKVCITGDICDELPLSRTTVSQHLKELRDAGLIQGQIDGQKINYCLCSGEISRNLDVFNIFLKGISEVSISCKSEVQV